MRGFKAKVGGIPEEDAERLAAIPRRGGTGDHAARRRQPGLHAEGGNPTVPPVRAPATWAWNCWKQPVPKWDLAGMAQVRAAVDVLIEADEAAYTPHDVVQIARHQAADVINIKIAQGGRPLPVQEDRRRGRGRRPGVRDRHRLGPGNQGRRQAAPRRRHPLTPRRRPSSPS